MWARVSTFALPADDVDKAIEQFNRVVDAFLGQPGLRGVDVFLNRSSARAFTVTLWESKEAMTASEETADRLRSEVAHEALGWIDRVDEYELIRTELRPISTGTGSNP